MGFKFISIYDYIYIYKYIYISFRGNRNFYRLRILPGQQAVARIVALQRRGPSHAVQETSHMVLKEIPAKYYNAALNTYRLQD